MDEHASEPELSALVDNELREPERLRVAAHLARCDTCRVRFEETVLLKRRLWRAVAGSPDPRSPLLAERIRARMWPGRS